MSFRPAGSTDSDWITQFSDPYECKDSPVDRKFNFRIHVAEDTVDRCIAEIDAFIEQVTVPWFRSQMMGLSTEGA